MPKLLLAVIAAVMLFCGCGSVRAEDAPPPIKIGDMYAYTTLAKRGQLYKKGWEKAVEEVNSNGGILGRKIEVISRDHGDKPDKAIRVVADLLYREKVDVLAGTILAHITNAIANYAEHHQKIPLVTMWNTMPASEGKQDDYMFSLMSTESQALAAAELAATLNVTKWATIAPNFAYGRLSVQLFKDRLKQLRPDVEFVCEQWPAVLKINANLEVSAINLRKPEAIFTSLFVSDLTAFVRAGNRINLFDNRLVVGLEAGERTHTNLIGKELRGTWYATGDASNKPKNPADVVFYNEYVKKFGSEPEIDVYSGYLVYRFLFAAIEKAGSTDPAKVAAAMTEVSIPTPMGEIRMSPDNHRSNYGVWLGRLQPTETGAELVDWEYKSGGKYLGMKE